MCFRVSQTLKRNTHSNHHFILFKIIPSFIFYIIISYIGSSHHSTQTTFFNPSLTHFWEVVQVPTTQSLTITEILLKIIPSLKQINLVLCYIYIRTTYKSYVRCKMKCYVCFRVSQTLKQNTHSNHHFIFT